MNREKTLMVMRVSGFARTKHYRRKMETVNFASFIGWQPAV